MPLRTRNQFVVKAHTADRTHAVPLHVHVRECDLPHFHAQERDQVDLISILLRALDGDSAFKALLCELDNVRAVDDLIKNKSSTLFHITTCPTFQIQWQLEDHPHSLINILERTQRHRDAYFTKKPAYGSSKPAQDEEKYVGGMLRPMPVRKAAVTVWLYPPHVNIPPTGDRIPVDDTAITDFLTAAD